jgi:hypothetical protein
MLQDGAYGDLVDGRHKAMTAGGGNSRKIG